MSAPRVIILGGVGFIGRNLIKYLAQNNLVSKICVSDKVLPATARLSEEESEIFQSDLVVFKQANLVREATIDAVFEQDGGNYDYVINLCGVTKYSQTDEIYEESIVDVARNCSAAAQRHGVNRWIEVSTGQVYKSGKAISDEGSSLKPWTGVATARLQAEQVLANSGLNFVVLRCATVYGLGDTVGLTPRLVIGAIYKDTAEKMELLWSKKLKIHTLHVVDCSRAIWHVISNGESGSVFNVVDDNDTDQGKINNYLEQLYGIRCGFLGDMKSKAISSYSMKMLTDTVNDKHLKPWSELCKRNGINDTPLTPYLDEELLYNKSLSMSGDKFKSDTGFTLTHPTVTVDLLREVVNDFIAKGMFPTESNNGAILA